MTLRAWKQEEDILKVVEWLWMMPLLSLPELKAVTALTYDRCNRLTKVLYRQGKVSHVRLGMTLEVQDRYFLTTSGVRYAMEQLRHVLTWQVTEQGLRQLIGRLPTLESFYRLAPRLWGHGGVEQIMPIRVSPDPEADELEFPRDLKLTRFQWQRDSNVHAISQYANDAWLPWVWVGPMTKFNMLPARRVYAESRLFEQSHYLRPQLPAGWVIVGSDLLAAVHAASMWDSEDALVTTADGRTMKRLRPREFGSACFDRAGTKNVGVLERIPDWFENDSILRGLNGKLNYSIFHFIAQWPGSRLKHLHLHFSHSHGEINSTLKNMAKVGLIVRLDGGHYLTRKGMLAAARMDRISHQSIYASFDGYLQVGGSFRRNRQRHDQAVVDAVLACERDGGEMFHGRRYVINWSNQVQLAPDAVAFIPQQGRKPLVWFVEVELSAKAPSSAQRKLRHYRTHLQSYGWTYRILMIVGTEAAEKAFLKEGRGLNMMITTLERFVASGPLGRDVWCKPEP